MSVAEIDLWSETVHGISVAAAHLEGRSCASCGPDSDYCCPVTARSWIGGPSVRGKSNLTELPALSPLSPLGSILSDIEKAIEARLYYPALLAALTLPEICTAMTLDRSVFVKEEHYVAFVDKYADGLGLTGTQCYRLRGGVVHRANLAGHPLFGSSHVIFTLPETKNQSGTRIAVHALTLQSGESRAATFDLTKFCEIMIAAARKWYADHKNDPKVAANMSALIRYCPTGLAPFFVGAPIVASGT